MRACAKEKKNYLCGTKPGMMRVLGGAVYIEKASSLNWTIVRVIRAADNEF